MGAAVFCVPSGEARSSSDEVQPRSLPYLRRSPCSTENRRMKYAREFVTNTVIGGVFIVVPVYLAILLLLKGMQSAVRLVRPFAALLPDWLPAEGFFSFLLVLLVCFVVGAAVRTRGGRAVRERLEKVF